MSRPRKRGYKDFPPNLYAKKIAGKTYYQYYNRERDEFKGMGTDKKKAFSAAIRLNQSLVITVSDLIRRVEGDKELFGDYLDRYVEEVLSKKRVKGQPLSQRTIGESRRIISVIKKSLGNYLFDDIKQTHISDYLEACSTSEVYNKHRAVLTQVFRQAVSDGKVESNLAERIIKRDKEATKRAPLSLEQYKLIFKQASPAIQNAMELSLNALQRRGDIQKWRFDQTHGNYYRLVVSKTKHHGNHSFLEIPKNLPVAFSAAGAETLEDIIERCSDGQNCPFLVHQTPKRVRASKEKEHPMQLSLKAISDGFSDAREAAGLKMEHPPTFHELLALGESLRFQQGWSLEQIQILRGHSKVSTTKQYLDRQINWTRVDFPKDSG